MASNASKILGNILDEVVALRKEVAELKSSQALMGSGASKASKGKAAAKPKPARAGKGSSKGAKASK